MVDHTDARPDQELGRRAGLDAGQLRGPGRVRRAAHRAGDDPGRRGHRGQGLRPARPRRRRLPDRDEVGLHPAGQPQAEVPGGQRRRVRAGHLQGHPADDGLAAHAGRGRDHRRVRHPGQPRLHLRPRRGAARRPAAAAGGARGVRGRVRRDRHPRHRLRPGDHRARRRGRVHLRRGDRAAGLPGGSARAAAAAAAVPGHRRPVRQPDGDQQRRVDRLGAERDQRRRRTGSARWAPRSPRA